MKPILILLLSLVFSCSIAQTFSYADSSFQVGQTKTIDYFQFYTHPIHDKSNVLIFDSLATFLKVNKSIKIRILNYTDQRGSEPYNLRLSEGRAEMFKSHLIQRGIDTLRVEIEGLGESNPIYTEEEIFKMETEEEREMAYSRNERTVIQIIENK